LNNEEFLINSDLIEFAEETSNTVVSMMSGRKLVVSESCNELQRLIIEHKRKIFNANFGEVEAGRA
jgi:flagellar protein FlbD